MGKVSSESEMHYKKNMCQLVFIWELCICRAKWDCINLSVSPWGDFFLSLLMLTTSGSGIKLYVGPDLFLPLSWRYMYVKIRIIKPNIFLFQGDWTVSQREIHLAKNDYLSVSFVYVTESVWFQHEL